MDKRGRSYTDVKESGEADLFSYTKPYLKNTLFRLIREALWHGKWQSDALIRWLDDFRPTAVFFVGGDSLFAYEIASWLSLSSRPRP